MAQDLGLHWQQTASGGAFDLANPRAQDVSVADIAKALSQQCRYNGHTREFYSVAQHACLVSKWMEEDGYPDDVAYAALHHDSEEAYTGDIITQVKNMHPALRAMADEVSMAVYEALDVRWDDWVSRAVKWYDNVALSTERRDVMPVNLTHNEWVALPDPRDEVIHVDRPELARWNFLQRHNTLRKRIADHAFLLAALKAGDGT